MKKLLMSMAAVSALAIGAPAAAQSYQGGYADTRTDALHARIQAGVQRGTIDRREAQSLRMQLRELTRRERQYARDGISRGERRDLQVRVQSLRQQIRSAEMRGQGRYGSTGAWGERDGDRVERDCPPGHETRNDGCIPSGQEGRGGRWEDRRDQNWEDRSDATEDRWNEREEESDDWSGRDRDGYDDSDRDRSDRLDSRDGVDQDRDGLRVGQRVSGRLDALPYEYRGRFRDSDGVYHRTDGRNIYRIDARTNVVLQVYPAPR